MITNITPKYEKSSQNLSSDSGLLLILKALEKFNVLDLLNTLSFNDDRSNPNYDNAGLLHFKPTNLLLGYNSQTMQARAINDKLFTEVYKVPSQPTISRLYSRVNEETITSMNQMITNIIRPFIENLDTVILDADSTNIVCHGKQEGSKHNSHYNNHGFHPLIVTEANTGLVLTNELRSGNKQCADGLEEHLKYIFDNFNIKDKTVMFRADSQFCNSNKLDLYESYNLEYAVKAMKRNKTLAEKIKEQAKAMFANDPNLEYAYGKLEFSSNAYPLVNVSFKAEQVKVEYSKNEDQLSLFEDYEIEYQIIFSNIDKEAKDIDFYNNRGNSENIFKELKQDFGMGNLYHTSFIENKFEALFSCFAYNLYKLLLKKIPQIKHGMTLSLFIRNYLRFASKVVFHARQVIVKVDASYRYFEEFMNMFESI